MGRWVHIVKAQHPGVGHPDLSEGVHAGIPRPRRDPSELDGCVAPTATPTPTPTPKPSPRPTTEPEWVAVDDLDQVVADLVKVVVRTSADGSCQENGLFLLGLPGGRWGMVPFTDPGANTLVPLLQTLPEFNAELLMEIIGARRDRLVVLWERAEP